MKKIILFIMSILLTQCFKVFDDELSLPLTTYTGNQIRIDGYYYTIGSVYDVDKDAILEGVIIDSYFFYENGIVLNMYGVENSLEEMDETIEKFRSAKRVYDTKYGWGVFVIEGNILKFELWMPGTPRRAFVNECVILNDTTFHIIKSYRSNKTEEREENELYYFRSYSPKPDSTNRFTP